MKMVDEKSRQIESMKKVDEKRFGRSTILGDSSLADSKSRWCLLLITMQLEWCRGVQYDDTLHNGILLTISILTLR
jgi:hypothetical protein